MKKIIKRVLHVLMSIILMFGILNISCGKSEAVLVSRSYVLQIKKYCESGVNYNPFLDISNFPYRDENLYGMFGEDGKEDLEKFYEFIKKNYDNKEGLKELERLKKNGDVMPLEGACFRLYKLRSEKDAEEFANNPQKYSTVEAVNEYIRKEVKKNPERMRDFPVFTVTSIEEEDGRVYSTSDTCENYEEYLEKLEKNDLYTNEKGEISFFMHHMSFEYFWIVENTAKNRGVAANTIEGGSLGMLYDENTSFDLAHDVDDDWGAEMNTLYPKNSIYAFGTDKNIDLKKTADKNEKLGNEYSDIYKLQSSPNKEYVTKHASLDNMDYINWVIDSHIDPRIYKKVEKFTVTDYLDSKLDLLDKSGKPYEDLINTTDFGDADITVKVYRKNKNEELEEKELSLQNNDYKINVEYANGEKKDENELNEHFGEITRKNKYLSKYKIKIDIDDIKSIFPDSDSTSTINIKINIGTKCKYNEYIDANVVYDNIYNDHDATYVRNDSEGEIEIYNKPEIPWVNTEMFLINKYRKDGGKKEKVGIGGAKFVIYRDVIFYDEEGKPTGENSIEFLTEDNNFAKANEGTVYKYDKEKDKIIISSGEKTLLPKLLTSDDSGDIMLKSVQGGTADEHRKEAIPLNINLQESYKIYEEKEFPVDKRYTAKYYIKEVCPPKGYMTVNNGNIIMDELENAFKTGKFTFKLNEKDNPTHIFDNSKRKEREKTVLKEIKWDELDEIFKDNYPEFDGDDDWSGGDWGLPTHGEDDPPPYGENDDPTDWEVYPPIYDEEWPTYGENEDPTDWEEYPYYPDDDGDIEGPKVDILGPKSKYIVSSKGIENELAVLPDVGGKGILFIMLAGLLMVITSTYCLVKKKGRELKE